MVPNIYPVMAEYPRFLYALIRGLPYQKNKKWRSTHAKNFLSEATNGIETSNWIRCAVDSATGRVASLYAQRYTSLWRRTERSSATALLRSIRYCWCSSLVILGSCLPGRLDTSNTYIHILFWTNDKCVRWMLHGVVNYVNPLHLKKKKNISALGFSNAQMLLQVRWKAVAPSHTDNSSCFSPQLSQVSAILLIREGKKKRTIMLWGGHGYRLILSLVHSISQHVGFISRHTILNIQVRSPANSVFDCILSLWRKENAV